MQDDIKQQNKNKFSYNRKEDGDSPTVFSVDFLAL